MSRPNVFLKITTRTERFPKVNFGLIPLISLISCKSRLFDVCRENIWIYRKGFSIYFLLELASDVTK